MPNNPSWLKLTWITPIVSVSFWYRYEWRCGVTLSNLYSTNVYSELLDTASPTILCVCIPKCLCKSLTLNLHSLSSNGTSMISLIIPPKDQISRVAKMLADEFGTASNIKSRVNRLSVLGAITSVQQRLKLYNKGTCYNENPNKTMLTCGIFFPGAAGQN